MRNVCRRIASWQMSAGGAGVGRGGGVWGGMGKEQGEKNYERPRRGKYIKTKRVR